jgi:hypothetical protein
MKDRLLAVARSPLGRATLVLVGLLATAILLRRSRPELVWAAMTRAAWPFAGVVLLEGVAVACSVAGMGAVYRATGVTVPVPLLVRTGLIGYAVAGLVPAGRAAAEATRAALVSPLVGRGRAGAAALRLQAVALLANSVVSFVAAFAAAGHGLLALFIAGNGVLTLVLGGGALLLDWHGRVGAFLARYLPSLGGFGRDLDAHLGKSGFPRASLAWELGARAVQIAQNGVLVAAVGGAFGLGQALRAEGIHLVGAAVGDLIPQQLGVTDANFTLSAATLGLAPGDAMAVALLAHLSQLIWVAAGALVPVLWPRPVLA